MFQMHPIMTFANLAYALRGQQYVDSQMGAAVPKHLFLFSLMRLLAANSRGRAAAAACHRAGACCDGALIRTHAAHSTGGF